MCTPTYIHMYVQHRAIALCRCVCVCACVTEYECVEVLDNFIQLFYTCHLCNIAIYFNAVKNLFNFVWICECMCEWINAIHVYACMWVYACGCECNLLNFITSFHFNKMSLFIILHSSRSFSPLLPPSLHHPAPLIKSLKATDKQTRQWSAKWYLKKQCQQIQHQLQQQQQQQQI